MTLQVGTVAPDFQLPGNGNTIISLKDFRGKKVVLYFYPKDDTPGCTNEAKDFTTLKSEFENANTIVIGISKDTPAKHDKFIDKHDLHVLLASDEAGAILEAYNVWVEKNMYGRKYMGIERATYLLDDKGLVHHIWRKVKVKGHAQQVLDVARAL